MVTISLLLMCKWQVIGLTHFNNKHDQNNQHVKFILSFSVLKFSYEPGWVDLQNCKLTLVKSKLTWN